MAILLPTKSVLALPMDILTDQAIEQGSREMQCKTLNCAKVGMLCSSVANNEGKYYCIKDTSADESIQLTEPIDELITPRNSIHIPYLKYTVIDPKNALDEAGYLYIPWIGEFLSALYKVGIIISSIAAAIVIILQGIKIITSGGGEEKTTAYKRIGEAVIGLILIWGSYILLKTINPDLVEFKSLKIKFITPIQIEEESDAVDFVPTGDIEKRVIIRNIDNISTNGTIAINSDLLEDVAAVAQKMKSVGINVSITSGWRALQDQYRLILANCKNLPGSITCDPIEGKPNTCILRDKNPLNCPHTTGMAVDMWGTKNGSQCILQKYCTKDPTTDPCRKNPCQAALITAMKEEGFCVLDSEAWHFEKPRMSAACH